eukprot:TRINITY_DN2655_c0_g1_i1.p1 TRINITY_DN2655_c0_g1~~TRINITY_DN2655_c0_g1_i1.p1  ORF type:complete len:168 (-),score=6.40 TRINITY_DN2655_c0_g1_i1:42-545(-)
MKRSKDGAKILGTPNAGGSSAISEVLSIETLASLYGAKLEKTEMELQYAAGSKITDFSVTLNGCVYGVSVTRAMKHRGTFSVSDAERLLTKKLFGVNESTRNVSSDQKWKKQILHVWTEKAYMADVLAEAWELIDAELKSDTLLILSVAESSPEIFYQYLDEDPPVL